MPGAKEFLNEAQQIGRVFGLTAKIQTQAELLMKFVGLTHCFDEIVGFLIEMGKMNILIKKMLLHLMEKHKLEQRQICYVGDSASDVKSGQEPGVLTHRHCQPLCKRRKTNWAGKRFIGYVNGSLC